MADSKKRTAGSQLTRDNPDPDEDQPEPEMGTFQKAPEEVMAKRRIVKVNRAKHQTAPTANPFAGIRLAPPVTVESVGKGKEESEKAVANGENEDGKGKENDVRGESEKENGNGTGEGSEKVEAEGVCEETLNPNLENVVKQTEVENESGTKNGNDSVSEIGEKNEKTEDEKPEETEGSVSKENVENKTEIITENEAKNGNKAEQEKAPVQAAPFSSFGQLSSSQNAFTGFAGTGTGFAAGSSFGTGTGSDFSSSVPIFGPKTDAALKSVQVETGEENEETAFNADAVLFEFLEGGWKERGKGEVKVNLQIKNNENNKYNKGRLVMRTKGNYRLVLNASLYADMSLKDMDKKGVTFACVNSAGEKELGLGLATFALKFKDGGVRDEFKEVVAAHKGEKERESEEERESEDDLKAPGNSPKET
ncbi:hypothetical protein LUZ60_008742 [Juncus effusus]|nr:hypothetical protein LUZ60_008742 [Juncus effusus]